MVSLEKLIARNLGCSRKQACSMLNRAGAFPHELSPDMLPLRIELTGRSVELHDSFHLIQNKPAGCITALSDRTHTTAAVHLCGAPLFAELRPVGRLDLDTTGLLLWTTDGEWLHRLTHPRTALPRTYHAALARPFQPLPANLVLHDGHRPSVLALRPLLASETHPSLGRPTDAKSFATITIAGGAYHEVRRIFAALGSHVLALCRVSFGALELPKDLALGSWRPINKESVESPL
jgi:16S rRNA pseudouridine516 synthase